MSRQDPVVLDLGGVLLDWDPRHLYSRLIEDEDDREWFLREVTSPAWNRELDRGRSWTDAVAELSARFPEHAELIAAHDTRWRETIAGAIPGTVAILEELHAQGTPTYALTNFSVDKFELVRQEFPFFACFDGWVVSGAERLLKPDPEIYRVLVDRFGVEPARTVYVDDVAANAEAATALGMIGLHFTGPEALRRDLERLGRLPPPAPGDGAGAT